jgi:hypothetical protein
MTLSPEWHSERSTIKLCHEPFWFLNNAKTGSSDSRFLQLRDGESRKEAGIILAEEAHIFSLRAVTLASHSPHLSTPSEPKLSRTYGSESVIKHDSSHLATAALAVMHCEWMTDTMLRTDNSQYPHHQVTYCASYFPSSILVPEFLQL